MSIRSILELPAHEGLLIITFIFYSLHLLTKFYIHRNLSNAWYTTHFIFSVFASICSVFLFLYSINLDRLYPFVFFFLMITLCSLSVSCFYRLLFVIEENNNYYEEDLTEEAYSIAKEYENAIKYLSYTTTDGEQIKLYFNFKVKIEEDSNDCFEIMYSKKRKHKKTLFVVKKSYTKDGDVIFSPPSLKEYNEVLKKINIKP